MVCQNMRMIAVGIVLLAVSACAAATTSGYTGPTLPGDQTALIESGPYTNIEKLDDQTITALRVSVLPGEHTVVMRPAEQEQPYREYLFYSRVSGAVKFVAEAGHRYLAYVDFVPAPGPADEAKGSGYTWIGYILDKSTGGKIANTGPLPLGAESRSFPAGFQFVPQNTQHR
jgi:hypothetical protein